MRYATGTSSTQQGTVRRVLQEQVVVTCLNFLAQFVGLLLSSSWVLSQHVLLTGILPQEQHFHWELFITYASLCFRLLAVLDITLFLFSLWPLPLLVCHFFNIFRVLSCGTLLFLQVISEFLIILDLVVFLTIGFHLYDPDVQENILRMGWKLNEEIGLGAVDMAIALGVFGSLVLLQYFFFYCASQMQRKFRVYSLGRSFTLSTFALMAVMILGWTIDSPSTRQIQTFNPDLIRMETTANISSNPTPVPELQLPKTTLCPFEYMPTPSISLHAKGRTTFDQQHLWPNDEAQYLGWVNGFATPRLGGDGYPVSNYPTLSTPKNFLIVMSDSMRDIPNTINTQTMPKLMKWCSERDYCLHSPLHFTGGRMSEGGYFSFAYSLHDARQLTFEHGDLVPPYPLRVLYHNNYTTACFSAGLWKEWKAGWQFFQFDSYTEKVGSFQSDESALKNAVKKYKAIRASGKNAYVFVFLHNTHQPWQHPPSYTKFNDGTTFGDYRNAINYLDEMMTNIVLSELADDINNHEVGIVLTSDHGEAFGDHGLKSHGQPKQCLNELLKVPLFLITPGALVPKITGPTSHTDVWPTLLDFAGMPRDINTSSWSDGRSLFRESFESKTAIITPTSYLLRDNFLCVIDDRYKFHVNTVSCPNQQACMCFDVTKVTNLADQVIEDYSSLLSPVDNYFLKFYQQLHKFEIFPTERNETWRKPNWKRTATDAYPRKWKAPAHLSQPVSSSNVGPTEVATPNEESMKPFTSEDETTQQNLKPYSFRLTSSLIMKFRQAATASFYWEAVLISFTLFAIILYHFGKVSFLG